MHQVSTPAVMQSSSSSSSCHRRGGLHDISKENDDKKSKDTCKIDHRMQDQHFLQAYQQLRKSVTCAICLEIFNDPVALSCSHVFCHGCISQACKQREQCPMCSQKIRSNFKNKPTPIVDVQQVLWLLQEFFDSVEPQQSFSQSPALEEFRFQPLMARRPPLFTPSPALNATVPAISNQLAQDTARPPLPALQHSSSFAPVLNSTYSTSVGIALPSTSTNKDNVDHCSRETSPVALPIDSTDADQLLSAIPSPPEPVQHEVGSLVNVLPRTWVGINKLGGVARVESFITDDSTGHVMRYYKVKYVLDGTHEENIHQVFVEPFVELSRERRRQSRASNASTSSIASPIPAPKSARKMRDITSEMANQDTVSTTSSATKRQRVFKEKSAAQLTYEGKENTKTLSTTAANELPITAFSGSASSSSTTLGKQYVLLTTAIEDPNAFEKKLEKLTTIFPTNVQILTQYTPEVTHLVVSTDKQQKGLMKQRTMKYMQCIMNGSFVVSTQWVQDSIKAKKMLPETDYEIEQNTKATLTKAPSRARESISSGTLLFQNFHMLLFGGFPLPGPQRTDIQALCTQGGSYATEHIDQFLQTFIAYIQKSNDEVVQYDTLVVSKLLLIYSAI